MLSPHGKNIRHTFLTLSEKGRGTVIENTYNLLKNPGAESFRIAVKAVFSY